MVRTHTAGCFGIELGHPDTGGVQLSRTSDLHRHERVPAGCDAAVEDVALGDAELLQLTERQVDTTAARVLLHVTEDVDQLQRDAQLIGAFEGGRIVKPEDAHAHAPHHRCDQVGIRAQLLPGLVPGGGQVHRDTVDEHVQLGQWDRVAAHRDREQSHHRIGAVAGTGVAEPATMVLEALIARGASVEVSVVVDLPCEVVERVDRGALMAWQRDESPVEVGGFAACHVLAVTLQRTDAARRRRVKHVARLRVVPSPPRPGPDHDAVPPRAPR